MLLALPEVLERLRFLLLQVDLFAVECRFVDWLQVHPQRWLPNLIHSQR